jgi:hypothetical protein
MPGLFGHAATVAAAEAALTAFDAGI